MMCCPCPASRTVAGTCPGSLAPPPIDAWRPSPRRCPASAAQFDLRGPAPLIKGGRDGPVERGPTALAKVGPQCPGLSGGNTVNKSPLSRIPAIGKKIYSGQLRCLVPGHFLLWRVAQDAAILHRQDHSY